MALLGLCSPLALGRIGLRGVKYAAVSGFELASASKSPTEALSQLCEVVTADLCSALLSEQILNRVKVSDKTITVFPYHVKLAEEQSEHEQRHRASKLKAHYFHMWATQVIKTKLQKQQHQAEQAEMLAELLNGVLTDTKGRLAVAEAELADVRAQLEEMQRASQLRHPVYDAHDLPLQPAVRLAQGVFGRVYAANTALLGSHVYKLPHPKTDPALMDKEAQMLVQFAHPNIVSYYGRMRDKAGNATGLIMERMQQDLLSFLESREFPDLFAPPEFCLVKMQKGDAVQLNPAVEVFVFGLLLLDMAGIGRPEHSDNDYVAHVATEQFDWDVIDAETYHPSAFVNILHRCLSFNPTDRPSMREVVQQLLEVQSSS